MSILIFVSLTNLCHTRSILIEPDFLADAIDGERAVQLATSMIKLEDAIDGANTAISKAQGALSLADVTSVLLVSNLLQNELAFSFCIRLSNKLERNFSLRIT